MITYAIAAPAETVINVTIDRTGNISGVHHGIEAGLAEAGTSNRHWQARAIDGTCGFMVRVHPGHSGVIEISPDTTGTPTLVPLGADRPFLDSELPPRAGADGAYSQSESIFFHVTLDELTWRTENMSGRVSFTAKTAAVSLTLRLTAGNAGEFLFPSNLCDCPTPPNAPSSLANPFLSVFPRKSC
jgi:hypothetical protein